MTTWCAHSVDFGAMIPVSTMKVYYWATADLAVSHARTLPPMPVPLELQVQSIVQPAQDSSAAECFRLILSGSGVSINRLLRKMQAPLLLLWGELSPHLCFLFIFLSCDSSMPQNV